MSSPHPFRFSVDEAALADLHARLDRTRHADEFSEPQPSWGLAGATLRDLLVYWRHHFDWPAAVERLNAFPQFKIKLDGLDLHFIHARSPHANATPLLITHGWPGSVIEFLELIPRLTEPERFGGSADDAFHVIAPSLQGYGGSPAAKAPGMTPRRIAERHVQLMAALGHERYVVQGGDWGSLVTHLTAGLAPDRVIAAHFNLMVPKPPADEADPMRLVRPHEMAWLAAAKAYGDDGSGYYHIQRTRPQTLAAALTDSPAGWCAWVAEKFEAWTDCERDGVRDLRHALSWDLLLTNASLYWFTGTIASSLRLYRESTLELGGSIAPSIQRLAVPVGVANYPAEILRSPRGWVERQCSLVHWFEAPRGGHFAAMEQPQVFAEDMWRFKQAVMKG